MRTTSLALALSALAAAGAGCADEFDPYEDVRTPRLLAIAAERPSLQPGESSVLSTLVTETGATYRWSWCPLVGPSAEGFPCLVERDQLQAAADEALGSGTITVPDFDLGTAETAQLDHSVPPEVWRGLCDLLQSDSIPIPVELPRCDQSFDVTVKVDVTMGETVINAAREVDLLYDDTVPTNQNPVATGLVAIDPDGAEVALDGAGTATLRREVEYTLRLAIAADQLETYSDVPVEGGPAEDVLEQLRVSWFHQGGELDKAATGTNADTTLAEARENTWTTPDATDWPDATSRLFVIVRDDRGGTSWLELTVGLQ